MKRSYLDFINEEEDAPFDPVDWQMQKPRVVQEPGFLEDILKNAGQFLGDRTSAILSPPRPVDLGKWATQDPDAEEGRYEPPIEDVLGTLFNQPALGLTGNQLPPIFSGALSSQRNSIADDVLRTAFDKVKNSVSSLDTRFNPGAYGEYFPQSKGMNVNLKTINEFFPDEGQFINQLDNTALHEIFHNLDDVAGKSLSADLKRPYASGFLEKAAGRVGPDALRRLEDFEGGFNKWAEKTTRNLPENLETRYGSGDIRFERLGMLKDLDRGLPVEEILATLFPNRVNFPKILPASLNKYLDWIRELGGGS